MRMKCPIPTNTASDFWGQNLPNPNTDFLTTFPHHCLPLQLIENRIKHHIELPSKNVVLGNLCCSSFPLLSPLPLLWNSQSLALGSKLKCALKAFHPSHETSQHHFRLVFQNHLEKWGLQTFQTSICAFC